MLKLTNATAKIRIHADKVVYRIIDELLVDLKMNLISLLDQESDFCGGRRFKMRYPCHVSELRKIDQGMN